MNSSRTGGRRIGRESIAGMRPRPGRARGRMAAMADVTQILSAAAAGDPHAAAELLPLVYDELRKLAAARLADEKPGQTLQATALVHEAYLRLVGDDRPQEWNGRGHFFAEAMCRILVENARRNVTAERGGDSHRGPVAMSEGLRAQAGQLSHSMTTPAVFAQGRAATPDMIRHSLPAPRTLVCRLLIAGGVIAPPVGG